MRDGERRNTRAVEDGGEVEKEEEVTEAVEAGRQRISLADSVQILRSRSL